MGKYFDYSAPASALDFSTGLSSVGDALTDVLNRRQRQREIDARLAMDRTQQAINQRKANEDTQRFKRQQHLDSLQGLNAIQGRLDQGDQGGAQAIAKAFDMQMEPGQPADVGPAPEAPVAPAPAQGVPPEIAARRRGRTLTSEDEAQSFYQTKGKPAGTLVGTDPLDPASKAPATVTSREFNPETQGARYEATSDMIAEEAAKADQARFDKEKPAYDQAAAAFPGQQRDYQAAQKRAEEERPFSLHMQPGDEGITIHGKSQQAVREGKAQQFLASFDGVNLSPEEKEAVKMGYGSIMAGEDPAKAMAAFRAQRTGVQNRTFKHGENQFHEGEADKRAAMMAQYKGPMAALDTVRADEARASGNRMDQGELRRDFSDWESKVAGLPLDGKSFKRLEFVSQNINSGNPLQQREAAEGLVGFFRGGVTTKSAQDYLLSHLSGLGGRAQTALEHARSGQYGPQDLAVLQEAANNALAEQKDLVQRHYESAKVRFGPGSGFESLGSQVNTRVRGTLREFGVDVPPIYEDAAPATPLGSTVRPYQGPKKRQRQGGAPPEVKAADKAKDASLDAAMQ